MKKNLRILLLLIICIAFVMSVSACVNGGETPDTPNTPDSSSSSSGNSENVGNDNNSSIIKLKQFSGVTFESKSFDYDGNEHEITVSGEVPSVATVSYTNNKATLPGSYTASVTITADGYETFTRNATLTIKPTNKAFVDAAKNSADDDKQEYDYTFNVKGKANILGFNGEVNGNYDAKYRYTQSTDDLQFKRVTSGVLFYDSTKYIINKGDQKITLTQDENDKIKKFEVDSADDSTSLINRNFESLINSLTVDQIENLKTTNESGYKYQFNINAQSNNAIVNMLLNVVKNLGLNISIKNISLTNPLNGVVVYFNFDSSSLRLKDYKLGFDIKTPIKGVDTELTLTYAQRKSSASVTLPSINNFVYNKSGIETELSKINSAIAALKNDNAYSLDLLASNEFDPGVTTWATKDSYTSRLYKNTDDEGFISFNNSYEYKTHHEEDGKETYKYTIGNVTEDESVYLVSRKGKNTYTKVNDVTQDTLFDGMTTPFIYSSSQIDCIKKETKGSTTTYYIYLNKQSTLAIKDKICEYINSNDAEGVIPVDNYFNNEDYYIDGADMVVTMNGNSITGISIETNIKYNPTDGEYTDRVIKLTDILTLEINGKLNKAQSYKAPKKADGTFSNLDYIL
ncbi:MAG: hypothetical protein HDT32_07470 [Clostridiales bacterium]|nr:hypothetical protein [Clostridiales bacterium]